MHILIMDLQDYSCLHWNEKKKTAWEQNTFDNGNPSMWTSFPPLLRNQTLFQYLSPDSIYSAQHTAHLNSHLVSQSLLCTAMQCIFHFPLQMVPVLHSAVHTYSFHGYMHRRLLWPRLLQLVIHLLRLFNFFFRHMLWPSCLLLVEFRKWEINSLLSDMRHV